MHPGMITQLTKHSLFIPGQYFADTAVTDAQAAGDLAGTHALLSELHDALSHHVR